MKFIQRFVIGVLGFFCQSGSVIFKIKLKSFCGATPVSSETRVAVYF